MHVIMMIYSPEFCDMLEITIYNDFRVGKVIS